MHFVARDKLYLVVINIKIINFIIKQIIVFWPTAGINDSFTLLFGFPFVLTVANRSTLFLSFSLSLCDKLALLIYHIFQSLGFSEKKRFFVNIICSNYFLQFFIMKQYSIPTIFCLFVILNLALLKKTIKWNHWDCHLVIMMRFEIVFIHKPRYLSRTI